MRKISFAAILILLCAGHAIAQTPYNPFTQNIHFAPEPTPAGFSCGTIQTVAFTQGLTTASNATQWQTEPLKVVVCLTGFTFNGPASSVVSGSYSSNFDWDYDPLSPNCIIGTQNQNLIGTGGNPIFPDPLSSGEIALSLVVPATSPISTVLAVNVNLIVPVYMQAFNSVPDDNEATQTQTFCALKITGTVFNDFDTLANLNDVNGIPIDTPGGVPLFVNLINTAGIVVAVTQVMSSGTYEFLNVDPNTIYHVQLSTNPGVVGLLAPTAELPPLWVNTGEDCCDQVGNDGNPNGENIINVSNFTIANVDFGIKGPPPTGPLPLELTGFYVTEYNCAGLLSWVTAHEENTSHVEIWRRKNGQNDFTKIASVKSIGYSQVEKMYSYFDKEVLSDQFYEYQLKFMDIDGQFTLSNVKTLKLNCEKINTTLNVFPNPAVNKLSLLFVTEEENVDLSTDMIDLSGRVITSKSKIMQNGSSVLTYDIQSLSKGTYILRYRDTDGILEGTIKFIKQ